MSDGVRSLGGEGLEQTMSEPWSQGEFECEFGCGFSSNWTAVSLHEIGCERREVQEAQGVVGATGAATTKQVRPSSIAEGKSKAATGRYECEFGCGFVGTFGRFRGHRHHLAIPRSCHLTI